MDPTSNPLPGQKEEPLVGAEPEGYRSTPQLLGKLEEATPGMISADLFSAHTRTVVYKMFDLVKEGFRTSFADETEVDPTEFQFEMLDVRVVQDRELAAASHNLEVAIFFTVRTPEGGYVYSPGFDGSPTQPFENPVVHISGQTLSGEGFLKSSFTPAAFDELLVNIEDCAGSGRGWPSAVIVQIRKALELEFRGGPQTDQQRMTNPVTLEGIIIDHSALENFSWTFETNEGALVTRPMLNSFKDFELRRCEE